MRIGSSEVQAAVNDWKLEKALAESRHGTVKQQSMLWIAIAESRHATVLELLLHVHTHLPLHGKIVAIWRKTHVHKRGENHVYKRAFVQVYLALLGTCQAGTPTAWKDLLNASRI